MKLIKKLLREALACNLEYESDKIRMNEIKSALNDDVWDDEDTYNSSDLMETEWLSKALNKGNYIDYYEMFVQACWDGMFQKPEYKGLDKKTAVAKLVNERFSKIAKLLNLTIKNWDYNSNILTIRFIKNLSEEMIDGQNMNQGTQTACNTMTVNSYKEGLQLIINAIGHPNENPKMWSRISKPLHNWQKEDVSIGQEVKSGGMSGDSMADESNTWWAAIQSSICEQGPDFQ